ncbi:MAG: Abi family protein [Campylobacteraceae bacterium]|nr:Abi family protein [Campylobacteraceae bacterium]
MSDRKQKLSVPQQISNLKAKGVEFNYINERKAIKFLEQNTYFFKLRSYRVNYDKDDEGRYIDLDFAYLVDLSVIDMHLRRFTLRLTLDIEHMLKTKLLSDFNASPSDGYDIMQSFFKTTDGIKVKEYIDGQIASVQKHGKHSPNSYILDRYSEDLAIWNFIEIIQFGHLIKFCNYFYSKYSNTLYAKIKHSLFNVNFLRNASAHNNCILLLKDKSAKAQEDMYQFLLQNVNLDRYNIKGFLKNHTINDFIASLVIFDNICSSTKIKLYFFSDLKNFFTDRMLKHKEYYVKNKLLTDSYKFVFAIVNFFSEKYKTVY